MKQYVIVKRSTNNVVKDQIMEKIYTDENLEKALEICRKHNVLNDILFQYELVELIPLKKEGN